MEWASLVDLAAALATSDTASLAASGEARLRCAVSRAYYGCLGHARELTVEVFGNVYARHELHGHVPLKVEDLARLPAVRQQGGLDEDCLVAAFNLRRLRRMRNSADYEQRQCTDQDAARAVQLAVDTVTILRRVAVLLPPPPAGDPDAS